MSRPDQPLRDPKCRRLRRRPGFQETLSALLGVTAAVVLSYGISRSALADIRSLPARVSAESVAGFRAVTFARTRQPFPPSGQEESLPGVRWRIHYEPRQSADTVAANAAGRQVVTVTGESLPEGFRAEYRFERNLP